MLRALYASSVTAVITIVLGLPIYLMGLIYPFRVVVAWGAAIWAKVILLSCGVKLEIEGAEHLAAGKPRYYMGNHQSALDIPIIILALKGEVRFMAKSTLFRIPLFGWVLRRYGHVSIDRERPRKALANLDAMLTRVKRAPISLAVFPEGTRSLDGRMLPFRQGTMKICQRAGLDVVPFTIDGSIDVHRKHQFRVTPGKVRLRFLPPIPVDEVAAMTPAALRDRMVRIVAEDLGVSGEDREMPRHDSTLATEQS